MANAVILKDGRVVRSTNFSNIIYYLSGFVSEFTLNNITYRYCSVEDFRSPDIVLSEKKITDLGIVGYFDKSKYLSYVKADGKVDITQINQFKLQSKHFEFANNQDDILVECLKIDESDLSRYPFVNLYTWKYDKSKEIVRYIDFEPAIIFPENLVPTEIPKYVCKEALHFYKDKIKLIQSTNYKDDRLVSAGILARIALYIHHINSNVFPLFTDAVSKDYILNQNIEWEVVDIFQNPTVTMLNSYLSDIREFYKQAFINQHMISRAVGLEKIYWLARGFSVGGLSIFPYDVKIKLIEHIVNNKTSDYTRKPVEEKLIVNLILSFNGNNIDDINLFLKLMKKSIDVDKNNITTLYQSVYEKMSTPWLITESTYAITNWIFNSTWEPLNTRQAFVKAVYRLWIVSVYNPYDINTNQLRSNGIGIRKLESGITKYRVESPINNDSNMINIDWSTTKTGKIFYYTTYSGNTKDDEIDMYGNYNFQITHPDASPILLPYNSDKFGGIYFDNMNFKFKDNKIQCFELKYFNTKDGAVEREIFYGEYEIFQPVTPIKDNLDSIMQLPSTDGQPFTLGGVNINSLIPVFLLHHIDEQGDKSDTQVVLGYIIDIASTLSGVGNISKLAHLRKLSLLNKVKIVVGTVEFATGSLGFMLNFADSCNNETSFCKNLKTFLFWVELSTLSTDIIVTKMMKSSAKRIVDNGYPSEFNDVSSKQKIEEIANGVDLAELLTKRILRIKDKFKKRIEDLNEGFDQLPFTSDHIDDYIDEIITYGDSLQLNDDDILGFLLVSCRRRPNDKRIYNLGIQEQMDNYVDLMKPIDKGGRGGVPYKFDNLTDFELFKSDLKQQLIDWDIPIGDLRVQGSSLRTPNAKDLDIAIVITKNQIEGVKKTILKRYIKQYSDEFGNLQKKSFEKAVLRLEADIKKGIIKPAQWGKKTGQKESFMTELYEINEIYPRGKDMDVSIIIKDLNFDINPYINF
jgi:hypothetical protein